VFRDRLARKGRKANAGSRDSRACKVSKVRLVVMGLMAWMVASVLLGPLVGKALKARRERSEHQDQQARSVRLARQVQLDRRVHQAPRVIPDRPALWVRRGRQARTEPLETSDRRDLPVYPDQLAPWDTTSRPSACTNGNL
jgi:hypothetical protein